MLGSVVPVTDEYWAFYGCEIRLRLPTNRPSGGIAPCILSTILGGSTAEDGGCPPSRCHARHMYLLREPYVAFVDTYAGRLFPERFLSAGGIGMDFTLITNVATFSGSASGERYLNRFFGSYVCSLRTSTRPSKCPSSFWKPESPR